METLNVGLEDERFGGALYDHALAHDTVRLSSANDRRFRVVELLNVASSQAASRRNRCVRHDVRH